MKNFLLGFLTCLCMVFALIQSYLVFCPHAKYERDVHITNQMLLPYDGFALKPFNNGPVFPYSRFPFFSMKRDNNESSDKNKAILPELIE